MAKKRLKTLIIDGLKSTFVSWSPNNRFANATKNNSKYLIWCHRDDKGWHYRRYIHQPKYWRTFATWQLLKDNGQGNLFKQKRLK